MDKEKIDLISKEVYKRCISEENFFGIGAFYHIESVVKNAVFLAKIYNADIEIVTLAAWLHDIASVTNYELYEDHHIHGVKIAEKILSDLEYDNEKIEHVKKCILNHRGSVLNEKETVEEKCIADADSISHFDNVPSLFNLAFVVRKYSISDGEKFVKDKLIRSYNKLSPESKKIYKNKYNSVMEIF